MGNNIEEISIAHSDTSTTHPPTLFLLATSLKWARNSLSVSPSLNLPSGMPSVRRIAEGTVASIRASRLSKPATLAMWDCSAGVMLLCRGSKLRVGGKACGIRSVFGRKQ